MANAEGAKIKDILPALIIGTIIVVGIAMVGRIQTSGQEVRNG